MLKEKKGKYDPLCMSAFAESRADLKPSTSQMNLVEGA